MAWTSNQHPSGHPPRVVAADGNTIPIPEHVHGAGGRTIRITSNANVRVGNEDDRMYEVIINIPSSISGDTRMVLGAAGVGGSGGAAGAYLSRSGFTWIPRFLLGQVVRRVASVAVGVLTPNQPASEIFSRRRLDSGAEVRYTILVQ